MDIKSSAQSKLAEATSADPTLRPVLNDSAGYAVFPEAGRGGLVVGGGYGKGVLYERGQIVGYCDMTLASAGAEIGGKSFVEIIVFKTPSALQDFKNGQFTLRGDTSAVALTSGAAANTQFQNGTAIYVLSQSGLMADASIGAQSFRYTPAETAEPAAAHKEGVDQNNTRDGVNAY